MYFRHFKMHFIRVPQYAPYKISHNERLNVRARAHRAHSYIVCWNVIAVNAKREIHQIAKSD